MALAHGVDKLRSLLRRKLVQDLSVNLVAMVFIGLSGLTANVIFGRFWGADALGVYSQALAVLIIGSIAGDLGLNRSVTREVARYSDEPDERNRLIGTAFLLSLFSSTLTACGAWLLYRHLLPISAATRQAACLFACIIPFRTLFLVATGLLNGLRRMKTLAVFLTMRWVLRLTGLVLGIARQWTFMHILYYFCAIEVCLVFAVLYHCRGLFCIRLDWFWARRHLAYGLQSMCAGFMAMLNAKVDVVMLGILRTDYETGIYSLAAELVKGIDMVGYLFTQHVNPIVSRLWANRAIEELRKVVRTMRAGAAVTIAFFCFLVAAVYPFLVYVVMDQPSYRAGFPVLYILLVGIGLRSAFIWSSSLLAMTDYVRDDALCRAVMLAANLSLNLVLIPMAGIVGAAAASSVAALVYLLLMRRMVWTRTRIEPFCS